MTLHPELAHISPVSFCHPMDSFRTNDEVITAYTDRHLMERRLFFVLDMVEFFYCIAN
jgi:hypothetical protein